MIMGGAIFTMRRIGDGASAKQVRVDFESIESALQMYKINAGHYPSEQQGLKALVSKPNTAPRPRDWEQTMDEIPTDPWNNEYVYKYPGSVDRSRPEIISIGKDGIADTEDDRSSQDEKK